MSTRHVLTWNRTHTIGLVALSAYMLVVIGIASLSAIGWSTSVTSAPFWLQPAIAWWSIGLATCCLLVGAMRTSDLAFPIAATAIAAIAFVALELVGGTLNGTVADIALCIMLPLVFYAVVAFLPYLIGWLLIRRILAAAYAWTQHTPFARPARWIAGHPMLTGCWIALVAIVALAICVRCVDYVGFATGLFHMFLMPLTVLIVTAIAGCAGKPGHWVPVAFIVAEIALASEFTVIGMIAHGHKPQWDAFLMFVAPVTVIATLAYLIAAGIRRSRHGGGSTWDRRIAAAICVVIVTLCGTGFGVWWFLFRDQREPAKPASAAVVTAITDFAYRSAPLVMNHDIESATGNVNYSPASLWTAAAIAAQGADGNTQDQLNAAIGATSLSDTDYRTLMPSANGKYDGSQSLMIMANSVWIDESIVPTQHDAAVAAYRDTVQDLFDAETNTVDLSADDTAQRIQHWVEDQTKGLVSPLVNIGENEVLRIASAVYADMRWEDPFETSLTSDDTFHGTSGDTTVSFMHQDYESLDYYTGDGWKRVDIPFDNGGTFSILLPDKGRFDDVTAALGDAFGVTFAEALDDSGYSPQARVKLALPRFDVTDTFQNNTLIDVLRSFGVTDAFDMERADFSRMADVRPLYVEMIEQSTRIIVNEEGAEAAAVTFWGNAAGAAPQEQEIEFVVDRPFLYMLTTPDDIPLFIGAVRNIL